ncbi:hypothetical protein RI444_05110 [Paenarthrobacter sp. AT5]|uniref:hypothetical protein n=1 Tax=Paenarthrobacter TaxID=1742992 RepID=UPI001A99FFDB|nr:MULTISPECIES: hypothetical protein [Paenarthrobacter]QSZ54930.1 hypothetical protein AYX19_19420 [Paenarthrobacter ureafaciens]WOC62021.1 hypothetical protein RI444_05110 [Paenarthrobacter sp. AT5]
MDTPNVPSTLLDPVPHHPSAIPFPPAPGPSPASFPWPSEDWWRCWRTAAISGRYEGNQAVTGPVGSAVELRLDVDPRQGVESPVLNKVSGDFFSTRTVKVGGLTQVVKTYVESWIVDAPVVTINKSDAHITGTVRFWKGTHPVTSVEVIVSWSNGAITGAVATFTGGGVAGAPYACKYRSDCFRDVNLELDYCQSVDIEPKVPVYNSHGHNNRPADLAERTLTIESSYKDAGIAVTIDAVHTVIDDSAPGFASWSVGELHDAMETSFGKYNSGWPAWNLWGVQAGLFDSAGVGGIMFDAAAGFGGAGRGPDRQGFAVFRNHTWFTNLVSNPATQDEAWAMRHFLYTWVHEAGHAFNFLHAWDKARPDSLSWMNYDWKYDQRNGADAFWGNFRFRFDDDELLHIRHGDRAAVIMGGDPWASGGHLESPPGAMTVSGPGSDIELTLSAKDYFDYMEPVAVEFRLRNTGDAPVLVDSRLDPRYGNTSVYVQKPDGTVVLHESVVCFYGLPELVTLAPAPTDGGSDGSDRYSELVQLAYGTVGFVFDQPGQYLVRAVYSTDGVVQASNTLPLRVGFPVSKEEDRFAPEFFTREVGLTLAFEGSMSPYLSRGLDALTEAAERFSGAPLGVKAATAVAQSVGDDFYRRQKDKMVKHHSADPQRALSLTEPVLASYQQEGGRSNNLAYRKLVELRTDLHAKSDDAAAAKSEVETLAKDLGSRGAHASVVAQVKELIPSTPAARSRRSAPRKPAK